MYKAPYWDSVLERFQGSHVILITTARFQRSHCMYHIEGTLVGANFGELTTKTLILVTNFGEFEHL